LQGFDNEIALEFTQNLSNGITTVKGRQVRVNEAILSKFTGILMEGKKWLDKHTLLQSTTILFIDPVEELIRKGKGYNPASFPEP